MKTYPYLLCRKGIYYFRKATPKDLLYFIGQREIIKTLGTTDARVARKAALEMSEQLDELFVKIRNGTKLLSLKRSLVLPQTSHVQKLKSCCLRHWRTLKTEAKKTKNGRLFIPESSGSKR